jgi:O-antigen/teichoic acid export membrane protein
MILIMIWSIVVLLGLTALYMISGKGGWLISGYNTMSKEEKAKYDEKKLCRWVGLAILLPTDLFMALILIQSGTGFVLVESIVFVVYIVSIIVITNVKKIGKI